jgi:hypothetical protein
MTYLLDVSSLLALLSRFIPCEISALEGAVAPGSAKTTDFYLANLAGTNRMELATLDQDIKHNSAFLIPP